MMTTREIMTSPLAREIRSLRHKMDLAKKENRVYDYKRYDEYAIYLIGILHGQITMYGGKNGEH